MGAYYNALPPACTKIITNGATYYTCNGYYYQPVYQGNSVQYMVVPQP